MNIKGKYPLFQSGGVLGGISKLLQGLGAEAKEALSTLLQEVVLALVLPDLHQIVLPPPPSLVRVNPRLVRLLPHFRARVAGPQRHCAFPFRWLPRVCPREVLLFAPLCCANVRGNGAERNREGDQGWI